MVEMDTQFIEDSYKFHAKIFLAGCGRGGPNMPTGDAWTGIMLLYRDEELNGFTKGLHNARVAFHPV